MSNPFDPTGGYGGQGYGGGQPNVSFTENGMTPGAAPAS